MGPSSAVQPDSSGPYDEGSGLSYHLSPELKSTAARKDVPVIKGQAHTQGGGHERTSAEPGTKGVVTLSEANPDLANQVERRGTKSKTQTVGAGTQVLPVDTNPVQDAKAMTVNTAAAVATEPAQGVQIPRLGPLPKFDKKAWMREYMRDHRKGLRRRAGK